MPEKILLFGSWNSFPGMNPFSVDLPDGTKRIEGSVVIIKSTSRGSVKAETPKAFISRTLLAKEHWNDVLACGCNDDLEMIVSNKRVVRKDVLRDNIELVPPFSFPGKLLAILFKRFEWCNGAAEKGLVIYCVEQHEDNIEALQKILVELAHLNNLQPAFLDWIESANHFYNKYS